MPRIGTCALCLSEGSELQDSHLLPKAVYKRLRDPNDPMRPHPRVVTATTTYTSSEQVRQHLLCKACEQRFSKLGESWVLGNGLQANAKTFPLHGFLLGLKPLNLRTPVPGLDVYAPGMRAEYKPEALAYFACSVIWRAGVSTWRNSTNDYPLRLGPYQELLRKYLVGDAPFPDTARVNVIVRKPGGVSHWTIFPEVIRDPCRNRIHRFSIPGFVFYTQLSNRPDEPWNSGCIMHSAGHRILVTKGDLINEATIFGFRRTIATHTSHPLHKERGME